MPEPKPMSDEVTAALMTRIEASLQSLLKVVNGNGDDGLVTKISHIKRTADENRADIKRLSEARSDAGMKFWIRVTALFTAIVVVMEVASNLLWGK